MARTLRPTRRESSPVYAHLKDSCVFEDATMPGASSSNGRRYGRGRWERSIIIVIAPAAHGPARWTGARQASRGRGAIDCELEGVKAADQGLGFQSQPAY
jgi:hypothetical protein